MRIPKRNRKNLKIAILTISIALAIYITTAVLLLTIFKDKIQEQVTATINDNINGEVKIGSFSINILSNFPNASFTIKDFQIANQATNLNKNEIINVKYIYLHINLIKLITGKVELKRIIVKNSSIHIYRLTNGLKNTDGLIKRSEDKGENNINSTLNKLNITVSDVNIIYEDTIVACNFFDFTITHADVQINSSTTGFYVSSKNTIATHQIIFNKDRGSALQDRKLQMQMMLDWNTKTQTYTILPTRVKDKNESFTLLGSISLQETKALKLIIYNHSITLQNAVVLATPYAREKLTGFDFEDPMSAQMVVKSNLIPNLPPDIDIYFNSSNNTFSGKNKKLNNIDFSGHYMNHLNDTLFNDETNNAVFFDTISGYYEGIPFNGKFTLNDFNNP
ncbi:MAG TPA: AsmA family protein, partial [Chitinophagales bacterium]|nr:AsmA family protein [Chitinophagales bacterium]HRG86516.1 AsmA family protein [Chitinophagales bacterium]HRH53180.1 AsmA family protein [Chitinophagales bacterium]